MINNISDELSFDSCMAYGNITDALEKHFDPSKWNVEVRSVIGEDHWENPIWSIQVFVETQDSKERQLELEKQLGLFNEQQQEGDQ